MATVALKLSPADCGRKLTLADFESAEFVPGFKYEIIDGKLYVSSFSTVAESWLEAWLWRKLNRFSIDNPEVINFVASTARVYLPGSRRPTIPEPDIAVYSRFPHAAAIDELSWWDVSPVLVVEVLAGGSIEKDLGRNRILYHSVRSIKEYWVLMGIEEARRPSLIQHIRWGQRWVIHIFPFGFPFTTKLLPGFELVIDPRS